MFFKWLFRECFTQLKEYRHNLRVKRFAKSIAKSKNLRFHYAFYRNPSYATLIIDMPGWRNNSPKQEKENSIHEYLHIIDGYKKLFGESIKEFFRYDHWKKEDKQFLLVRKEILKKTKCMAEVEYVL